MKLKVLVAILWGGAFFTSCNPKQEDEVLNEEGQKDEVVDDGESGSDQDAVFKEWAAKLSDPGLDRKERSEILREFGMDERVPVYDLVLHVTENLPEKDWFSVFFHRINEEEKSNIVECLRAYPLLDKGRFAEAHCDRGFGLAAGEQAPLEGIAWCEGIEDRGRRKSAAYGLKVSIPRYAKEASVDEVKLVLRQILSSRLFEDYEKDQLAFTLLVTLNRRGLLKEDALNGLEGLLSEDVLRRIEKETTKSGS